VAYLWEFFLRLQIYDHVYNIVFFTLFVNIYKTQIISLRLHHHHHHLVPRACGKSGVGVSAVARSRSPVLSIRLLAERKTINFKRKSYDKSVQLIAPTLFNLYIEKALKYPRKENVAAINVNGLLSAGLQTTLQCWQTTRKLGGNVTTRRLTRHWSVANNK